MQILLRRNVHEDKIKQSNAHPDIAQKIFEYWNTEHFRTFATLGGHAICWQEVALQPLPQCPSSAFGTRLH
jgi:hypothetical protein